MGYTNLTIKDDAKKRIAALAECMACSQAALVSILSYADVKTAAQLQRRAAVVRESDRASA